MIVKELIPLIQGKLVCGDPDSSHQMKLAFASDLMSDVLTLDSNNPLLITGLCNLQTIRTAEMADIHVIIFARNKKVTEEMIHLATQHNMMLIETPYSIFRISGILYKHGIKPIY